MILALMVSDVALQEGQVVVPGEPVMTFVSETYVLCMVMTAGITLVPKLFRAK